MTHVVVNTSGALTAVLTLTITDITQANPGVVTAGTHALATGDEVLISGVVGMTEVNDRRFIITVLTSTTFSLDGENTTGHTGYTSDGTCTEIRQLFATVTAAGVYTLTVDATDLTGSEQLELRIFGKARTGDTERLAYYVSVVGDQDLDLKISLNVMSPHHFRATLEQTGGTGRAYEWAIYETDEEPAVAASEEQTATLTTEHVLQELTGASIFQLAVDVANLTGSEQLELRAYGKARTGDTERLMYYGSFVGAQTKNLKLSENIWSPHFFKVTLEQTGGTGRAYPWAVYDREGLEVPLTIADLVLWLRADLGITLNGADVSAWADQSGNGNDAAQATEADQPAFTASAINSQPAVTFTQADSNFLDLGDVLDFGTDDFSLFVIYNMTARDSTFISKEFAAQADRFFLQSKNTNGVPRSFWRTDATTHFEADFGATDLADSTDHIIIYTLDRSGLATVYLDGNSEGTQDASGSDGNTFDNARNMVIGARNEGGQNYFDGHIAEIGLYMGKVFSAGERATLDAYALARYAI